MGKMILIDGIDGSGKTTQVNLLVKYFENKGKGVITKHLPNYASDSSGPVRMSLHNSIKNHNNPVADAYMFAIDRYITFKNELEEAYNDPDTIIILDRWTLSNVVYQSSRYLIDRNSKVSFNKNYTGISTSGMLEVIINDLEHRLLNIPYPDITIILWISPHLAVKNIQYRNALSGTPLDKYENDVGFLNECASKYSEYSSTDNRRKIQVDYFNTDTESIEMRPIDDIHKDIVQFVDLFIK